MTPLDSPISIHIDTNCLKKFSSAKPGWQALLKMCKEGTVRMIVSEVALQEIRSQWRDPLQIKAAGLKSAIDKLSETWERNPATGNTRLKDSPHIVVEVDMENFEIDIEDTVDRHTTSLITENNIEIREIQQHHATAVLEKYCKWEPPFNKDIGMREDPPTRKARKNNIPDAWIIEDAIDLHKAGERLYVLSGDKCMTNALQHHGIEVFKTPEEIVLRIEETQRKGDPAEFENQNSPNAVESISPQTLATLVDTTLIQKVLGYAHWLSDDGVISKEKLVNTINQEYGYTIDKVKSTADYLSHVSGMLKDTGQYYIISNSQACENIGNEMIPEVLSLLNDE